MQTFNVTVRTADSTHQYTAIAANSHQAWDAAMDRFGPFCYVRVTAG